MYDTFFHSIIMTHMNDHLVHILHKGCQMLELSSLCLQAANTNPYRHNATYTQQLPKQYHKFQTTSLHFIFVCLLSNMLLHRTVATNDSIFSEFMELQ